MAVSASSADTDLSSSVDNIIGQRPSPQPAADLRANLRKTSQPPAFIRPPAVSESPNNVGRVMSPVAVTKEHSPSPGPQSSVPWRTGKVASSVQSSPSCVKPSEPVKTDELTARIEALTAMANQTVAKVDRLTATPTPEMASREVNGATPSGSVKAVASKLLNRVQPKPVSPLPAVGRRPVKMEGQNASTAPAASMTNPVPVATVSSPAVQLSPAAPSTPSTQQTSLSKNRPPVEQIDKKLAAASPSGVAVRANTSATSTGTTSTNASNAVIGRNKTADLETTQNKATNSKPVGSVDNGGPSSIKAVQGILKKKVEGSSSQDTPIVRSRPEIAPPELYPILRVDEETIGPSDPVSILKKRFEEVESTVSTIPVDGSTEPHSILKRPLSRDDSAESGRSQSPVDPLNSILKRAVLTSSPGTLPQDQVANAIPSDPRPILKKRSSSEEPGHLPVGDGPRPILKKKSSTEDEHEPPATHKPILKSGRITSSDQLDLDAQIGRLRKTERRETSPAAGREPDATNEPEDEQVEGEESRQLSVAERISSMELQTNPTVAPWRLPTRPALPVPSSNGVPDPAAPESIQNWRRCVLSKYL